MLFDILSDICNDGLPKELEGTQYRYNEDWKYWEVDFTEGYKDRYYGFGWLTLKQIQHYLYRHNPYFVSVAFYDRFIELGGKFPEAMITVPSQNDYKITFEVLDEDEYDFISCLIETEREFAEVARNYNLEDYPEDIRVVFAFDC